MRYGCSSPLRMIRILHIRTAHTGAVILRPYQESCLESCLDALAQGCSKIGVSLPTGAGKTVVFVSLLSRICASLERPLATRSLVIVNSIELARQAADQAKRLFPQWSVEIEQGTRNRASGMADLTVATYQTLMQGDRLAKFQPSELKAIIIDEAHHAASPSYRFILSRFDSSIKNPKIEEEDQHQAVNYRVPIIGFSATFSRHDGLALGAVFDRIVYHRDFLEMIKEQWLCNVRFTCVRAKLSLQDVTINSRTGDYNPTSLAQVINTPTINDLVIKTWMDRAAVRKSTLVFCVNLAHVRELTQVFRDGGVDARYLHAKTPAAERRTLIAAFKAAEFPVLINCAILTEGADIPNIDCVLVARPTRSKNVLAQMIGRGMRLSPDTGKNDCHIIDFVDIGSRAPGLVSTPTLFGLDPSEVVEDEPMESLEKRAEDLLLKEFGASGQFNTTDEIPVPKSVTYTDFDNPFSFASQSSGAPHIAKFSSNAWVGCGGDIHVLECMGRGHIRIQPALDGENLIFEAHYSPPSFDIASSSPFGRNRRILTAQTLEDAVKGADTYAKKNVGSGTFCLGFLRTAKWRRTPASESQKTFVAARWGKASKAVAGSDSQSSIKKIETLTKGEAANIITRIKHGALSRFQARAKTAAKEEKTQLKERRRKAREVVEVGPLHSN